MNNKNNKLRLFFVGDFYSKSIDHVRFSPELESVIRACDIAFCNFEAPIETEAMPIEKVGPSLSQSRNAPEFLEKKGFNIIRLANNHIADFGQEGISQTINSFQQSLLLGVGNFEQAYSLKIKKIGNQKIGFLAFSHYEFGVLDSYLDDETLGYAWINHPCVDNLIQESKKEVDLLILIAHAGVEDIELPLPEWRERYRSLINLGVDAIIGMHPHVPQGWELIDGKPVFYSLGNFCFDMYSDTPLWNNGLAVVLDCVDDKLVNFNVINLLNENGTIKVDNNSDINEHVRNLSVLLSDNALYISSIDNMILDLWNNVYERYLFIGTNGLTLKYGLKFFLKRLYGSFFRKKGMPLFLLNMFRCESHRWLVQRALILKNMIE